MLKTQTKDTVNAIAKLGKVLSADNYDRPKTIIVPGSDCKTYRVILYRDDAHSEIKASCCIEAGKLGHISCKGNEYHGQVCKHVRAAVQIAASKGTIYWCDDKVDAERVARLVHGKVLSVYPVGRKQQATTYFVYTWKRN
jgi:hypothetical protein